jgi:hypothetical protein
VTNDVDRLSAYLAEATGDAKYTTAAKAAGTWIRSYRNSAGLVLDSIDAKTCQLSDASWVFTCVLLPCIGGRRVC